MNSKKQARKQPKCWICKDLGFIIYHKQDNGYEYEMFAKCNCQAALQYQAIDIQISDKMAEWVAERNVKEWLEKQKEVENNEKNMD